MMHGYGFDGSFGMFGGGLVMGLFWLVLIVLAAVLVWQLVRRQGGGGASSARRLLDERYARGEIDREEYLRKLDDLSRSTG